MNRPPPAYDGNEVVQIATVVPAAGLQTMQQQPVTQAQQMQQIQEMQQAIAQQQQAMEQMKQMHQREMQMQQSQNELAAKIAAQKQQMVELEAKHKEELAALQQTSATLTSAQMPGSASVAPERPQDQVDRPGVAPVAVPWPDWMPTWVPAPTLQDISAEKKKKALSQTLYPTFLLTLLWLVPFPYFAPFVVTEARYTAGDGYYRWTIVRTVYTSLTSSCSSISCFTGAPSLVCGKLTLFAVLCLAALTCIIWAKNFPRHPNNWAGKEFNKKFFMWASALVLVIVVLGLLWLAQSYSVGLKVFGWGALFGFLMFFWFLRAIRVINSIDEAPAQSALVRAPTAASGTA